MRQPISVLVYPVVNLGNHNRYLLLRRVAKPSRGLGSFWQGITGGLEEGEILLDAAKRELFEETGFVPSRLEPVGYSYSFPVQDQWRRFYAVGVEEIVEHVFIAVVSGLLEPKLSQEHDRWGWYSLDEALGRLSFVENIEGMKRCDSYLST